MSSPTSASASNGAVVDRAAADGVAVVGAGIVGACIALELARRGLAVTLLDRDEPGRGCSYGNSGAITM